MGTTRIAITKRRCLIIVLMLLAWGAGGAIVNVAVAWFFASQPSTSAFTAPIDYVRFQYEDRSLLDGMVHRKFGTSYVAVGYARGRYSPREDRDDVPAFVRRQPSFARGAMLTWFGNIGTPKPPSDYIAVIARGWPMLSVYSISEVDSRRSRPGTRAEFSDRGAIVIPAMARRNTGAAPFFAIALPCRPIWPGFAINTVFYAAILWGLFAVPLALRKRRRIKRGWCPKCAYDLRGRAPTSTVCPECGLSVEPTT